MPDERHGSTANRPRLSFSLRTAAIPLLFFAAALSFFIRSIDGRLGSVPTGIKLLIPLAVTVLDDRTGRPIPGAEVEELIFHPTWDEDEIRRRNSGREQGDATPWIRRTDEAGRVDDLVTIGVNYRHRRYTAWGLVPYAGDPELNFHPATGLRVRAEGYKPWTRRLEDVRIESGRPLTVNAPMRVDVRLRRAEP